MNLDDTIVAIATPPGRGGIGVVRLAGPEARTIAGPMLRLKHPLEPLRATFGELIEPLESFEAGTPAGETSKPGNRTKARNHTKEGLQQEKLDEVVVTLFAKPHSYTTDDILEISAHGSPVVLRHIVELALARGARLAEPGEFTMRAFLNGRIDLTQAEAVRELIDSQTLYQAKIAAQQLEGALSRRIAPIKEKLVELIALLEAGIDFAEDDVSVLASDLIGHHIAGLRAPLQELASSFAYGKLVHQGLTLAIVGRPNVGKSSLFNRLVERERAIVTATPGTTRDLVTETVTLEGIPVRLIDTAGIRDSLDEAEAMGIRKSYEALADADLILMVRDASKPLSAEDDHLLRQISSRPSIIVANKSDLARRATTGDNPFQPGAAMPQPLQVETSALTGEGIPQLRRQILHHIAGDAPQLEAGFLTNARHQSLVQQSLDALDAASQAVEQTIPHEMLLMDLYNSLRSLDEITGSTTTDDILNLIFTRFCIGK